VKTRFGIDWLAQGDIAGKHDNRYAKFDECCLDCDLQDTRHLLRLGNEFAVVTLFTEKAFWMSLLEIPASDFITRNVGRNGEDRDTTAVGIVQSVN
jgi:hypothetical protein